MREQVFALRRYLHSVNSASSTNYATHIHGALTAIMKESFEEEYRKLATVVGKFEFSYSVRLYFKTQNIQFLYKT